MRHSFVSTTHFGDQPQYNGGFENKSEVVEMGTYVWTACDINKQIDYYLIQTSITCHNETLDYQFDWNKKYIGPYFGDLTLATWIDQDKQTIVAEKCLPRTSTGSTTYSESSGFSIDVNAGGSNTGPSGMLTGGVTVTKGTDLADITHQQLTVDTYTLITLPSDSGYSNNDTFELNQTCIVRQEMLTGWMGSSSVFFYLFLKLNCTTKFTGQVQKIHIAIHLKDHAMQWTTTLCHLQVLKI